MHFLVNVNIRDRDSLTSITIPSTSNHGIIRVLILCVNHYDNNSCQKNCLCKFIVEGNPIISQVKHCKSNRVHLKAYLRYYCKNDLVR